MESLLANYGSDDDEDEGPQDTPRKTATFPASLPPLKISGDAPVPRSGLFASLPRPKFENEDSRKPDFRVLKDANEEIDSSHRGASDLFNNNKQDRSASRLYPNALIGAEMPSADDDTPKSKRGSLFSALPPPKSTGPSVGLLQSQPLPGFPLKRVVQLRPNINTALLKDLDDDSDVQPQAKRHATDVIGSGKPTGLAAILPKPKNPGSTLGSGYAPGHHASVDIETAAVPASENSTFTPHLVEEPSSFSSELPGTHTDAVDPSEAFYQSDYVSYEGAEVLCPEGYYEVPDEVSDGMIAHDTSTVSSAQDPLADMLLKERKKGGKNAPVNIIEVKQADLTAKKVREDQLRTTGIAFGPAYRV